MVKKPSGQIHILLTCDFPRNSDCFPETSLASKGLPYQRDVARGSGGTHVETWLSDGTRAVESACERADGACDHHELVDLFVCEARVGTPYQLLQFSQGPAVTLTCTINTLHMKTTIFIKTTSTVN